jgi:hypothetical protein
MAVSTSPFARFATRMAVFGAVAAGAHCGTPNQSLFDDAERVRCPAGLEEHCGKPCSTDDECFDGLHCGFSGTCTAACAPTMPCDNGRACTPRGRCEGSGFSTDASVTPPDASTDVVCAEIEVQLTKLLPKVLFLLDQSSSMRHFKFPSGDSNGCNPDCRWTVLKDVLIGPAQTPGGLIKEIEGDAELGLEMYSATDDDPNDGDNSFLPPPTDDVCPRFNGKAFDGLSFAVNNAAAIDAKLRPASVDDDTPTAAAIRTVVGLSAAGAVVDTRGFAALAGTAPKVLVLVTDGEPTLCNENYPSEPARQDVISAVQQTYAEKIQTFVVAIGDTTAQAEAHFKAVANAGQGKDPVTGDATAIRPTTTKELSDALEKIVLDARSCIFTLAGQVEPGTESQGTVILNGSPLPFAAPGGPVDGWRLNSPSELELVGEACSTLKKTPDAQLSATFPCGTVTTSPH